MLHSLNFFFTFVMMQQLTVVSVYEKQEVVPSHYNELKDNNCTIPNCYDDKSDIKIESDGYSIAINNSANNSQEASEPEMIQIASHTKRNLHATYDEIAKMYMQHGVDFISTMCHVSKMY